MDHVVDYFCVQVLLHDPKEEPLMVERGLKVSPGFSTQIAVTAKHVRKRDTLCYVDLT